MPPIHHPVRHPPPAPPVRPALVVVGLALLLACLGWGCSAPDGQRIEGRTVSVACGNCVFHMARAEGCPWAAEIGGEHYLVQGAVPQTHQNHAPDGICNMPRQAIVDGVIRGDKLIVTRLELLPAADVPAAPRFTPQDQH